jgi:electron transport complex protein RnfB
MNDALILQIDALLPQTQCEKCGYPGCRPYAQAISQKQADINRCPPGGEDTILKLAQLMGITTEIPPPAFEKQTVRHVAVINESECIGCTKCIPPCPVDAILGAAKLMHTVIAQHCTGCELCIAPCPVNCISMVIAEQSTWNNNDAQQARTRHQAKLQRLAKLEAQKAERLERQKQQLAQLKKSKLGL